MESLFGDPYTLRTFPHPTAADRIGRSYDLGQIYYPSHYAHITAAMFTAAPAAVGVHFYGEMNDDVVENDQHEAMVICRQRVIRNTSSDTPVSVSVSWLRGHLAEACPKLLECDRITEGTPAYIKARTGTVITHVTEAVSTSRACATEARLLEIDLATPVMRKRIFARDREGRLIEFSESSVLADRWSVYQHEVDRH